VVWRHESFASVILEDCVTFIYFLILLSRMFILLHHVSTISLFLSLSLSATLLRSHRGEIMLEILMPTDFSTT